MDWTEEEVKTAVQAENASAYMMGSFEANTDCQSCPESDQNVWALYPHFIQSLMWAALRRADLE